MALCFLCKKPFFDVKVLFTHFDFQHSDHCFDSYHCAEGECSRSFYLKNSYCKHLTKHNNHFLKINLL